MTAETEAPNLVLVTIDSLRADHCGTYEAPPAGKQWRGSLTPALDGLARAGVTFERAVAPGPRTTSSVPVWFTGAFLPPGVYESWPQKRDRWDERRRHIRRHLHRHGTLAGQLRRRGYATGAVTANPWTTPDTGFEEDFDRFLAVGGAGGAGTGGWVAGALDRLASVDANGWLLTWPDFYEEVLETRAALSEPYFLWVFLLDPHQPYLAPRRYRSEVTAPEMYYANYRYNRFHGYIEELPPHLHDGLLRSYRDAVRSADGFLGRLLGDLATDDPTVVITSDHGEAFREHGVYSHRPQLYEENIRVPLVVHGPDAAPSRVTGPTSLRRLPLIMADLADGRFAPDTYTDPYVLARTESGERTAVRTREWKYIRGGRDWAYVRGGEGRELYHLGEDPAERRNRLEAPDDADREGGTLFDRLLDRHERTLEERSDIARVVADLEAL